MKESYFEQYFLQVLGRKYEMIEFLLSRMSALSMLQADSRGRTSFYIAANLGDVMAGATILKFAKDSAVKCLLTPNKRGMTPLWTAAFEGRTEFVRKSGCL